MVVFNESNVIGSMTDKLTSMIGKLSTQNRQTKPFKPLTNSGMGD